MYQTKALFRVVENDPNYVKFDGKQIHLYLVQVAHEHGRMYTHFVKGSNGRQIEWNGHSWTKEFDEMRTELEAAQMQAE
mgnify:FL=1